MSDNVVKKQGYKKPAGSVKNGVKKNYKAPKYNANKSAESNVAEELTNVIKIVKYNANIRRHTSLNILKTFVEDGFIPETKGAFVDFLWDKYTVKQNNITKEYPYDKVFAEALVKAHQDMANDSAAAIKAFVEFANIN